MQLIKYLTASRIRCSWFWHCVTLARDTFRRSSGQAAYANHCPCSWIASVSRKTFVGDYGSCLMYLLPLSRNLPVCSILRGTVSTNLRFQGSRFDYLLHRSRCGLDREQTCLTQATEHFEPTSSFSKELLKERISQTAKLWLTCPTLRWRWDWICRWTGNRWFTRCAGGTVSW